MKSNIMGFCTECKRELFQFCKNLYQFVFSENPWKGLIKLKGFFSVFMCLLKKIKIKKWEKIIIKSSVTSNYLFFFFWYLIHSDNSISYYMKLIEISATIVLLMELIFFIICKGLL